MYSDEGGLIKMFLSDLEYFCSISVPSWRKHIHESSTFDRST